MEVKKIIEEIEKLPADEKEELFSYVGGKIRKREYLISILNKIKGSGKGVWNMDAQDYVNQLRSDEQI